MNLSRREQTLGTITLLAALFSVIGFTARARIDSLCDQSAHIDALRRQRDESRELINLGDAWRQRYEAVKDQMPVFEQNRQVDTYWLSRMDALASQFGVKIIKRQVGKETLEGDVYEFPVECSEWEGSLDAFVKFLHAMQSEGAMLDVRDMRIRPHSNKSLLRGSFTLYCAYMRGESAESAAPDKNAGSASVNAASGEGDKQ